jgi:nucleotide-binding universal stress UspA family protein
MVLKDILVHIDNSKACPARLSAAIELAHSHRAHLTGLYTMPFPNALVMDMAGAPGATGIAQAEIIHAEEEASRSRAAEAELKFKQATADSGGEWRSQQGEPVGVLTLNGRCFDLIVIGQAHSDDLDAPNSGFVDSVIVNAGRPLLVIPYIGIGSTIGKRVLIAWDGSRESARALNDSLALIANAESVEIVTLDADSENRDIAGDARRHLVRHGIDAELLELPSGDLEVEQALLARCSDRSIDLLVMGAYGHSRLREKILGGATRDILKEMTIPVLMSH